MPPKKDRIALKEYLSFLQDFNYLHGGIDIQFPLEATGKMLFADGEAYAECIICHLIHYVSIESQYGDYDNCVVRLQIKGNVSERAGVYRINLEGFDVLGDDLAPNEPVKRNEGFITADGVREIHAAAGMRNCMWCNLGGENEA